MEMKMELVCQIAIWTGVKWSGLRLVLLKRCLCKASGYLVDIEFLKDWNVLITAYGGAVSVYITADIFREALGILCSN